jgi:hypothetical protein
VPDRIPAELGPEPVEGREQHIADLRHAQLALAAEEPIQQRHLKAQRRAVTGHLAPQISQHPVRASVAANLLHTNQPPLGKIDERSASVADDDPAEQDNPQLSWPQSLRWRQGLGAARLACQ